MTKEDLEALIARDQADIVDIITTSVKEVPDMDAFTFAIMQMQMLSRVTFWTCDVLAARMGGWESEALEEPSKPERYDA